MYLGPETGNVRCVPVQVISAYRQPVSPSAGQYQPVGPSAGAAGVPHRTRPYVLPSRRGPYYVEPGHSALHGYSRSHQQADQIAYEHGAVSAAHLGRAPVAASTGDQYEWKIAGFSECSQTCGGGNPIRSCIVNR